VQTSSSHEIDAIARGVQDRYVRYLGLSTALYDEVVAVARKLHLPEAVIDQWLKDQAERNSSPTDGATDSPEPAKRKPPRGNDRGILQRSKPRGYFC
jgi:hypothetical protein